MIELDDINRLEDIFDERYVKKRDCDKNIEKTEENIKKAEEHANQTDLIVAKISTKLNLIVGILGVIGTAIVAAVVKLIFGG